MNPEKIGRYEIRSELGRGGMATVYRAYDPRFEREVALKVLPHEMLHDAQFRTRFEREAKTIAMLEHPAIVPVYDVGEEDGQPYFVMRYMTGNSLQDRLKVGPLDLAEASRIMEGIASALDDAHTKGIIHRDLKPGNILFDNHNKPYISDFGIAKFAQAQTNVTGNAIVGTPAYISPEQAQGDAIDGRSDIYALGVILFEMLSGRQPYEADTPMAVVVRHITDPIPHILDINPGLPPDVELVIERAMAKDRDQRFSTAEELSGALKSVVNGQKVEFSGTMAGATRIQSRPLTSPIPPTKTPTTPAPTPGKRNIWLWVVPVALVGICLVAVVAGGGGAWLMGGGFGKPNIPIATEPVIVVPSPEEATATELPVATTEAAVLPDESTPTATLEPSPTPEPSLPTVGGADQIAFLRNNDIWIMNVDGTGLTQVTSDKAAKSDLQWLPDGNTILYLSGKLVKTVNVETNVEEILVAYNNAKEFSAFQVSPDGKQVAISFNQELFVVPFDVPVLAEATKQSALIDIVDQKGCLYYNEVAINEVRWSDDGTRVALKIIGVRDGLFTDLIRVLDISKCSQVPPDRIDDFPGQRFDFPRDIVSYDWDGDQLFLLNSNKRNDGFGDMVDYSVETHKHAYYAPIEGVCCYRDPIWSPDGTYVLFVFQDIRLGSQSPIQFYITPYGSLGQPGTLTPISGDIPSDFFTNVRDKPQPVFRPAQP